MPYVTKKLRKELVYRDPEDVGELTYLLYRYYVDYITGQSLWGLVELEHRALHTCHKFLLEGDVSYSDHAEVLGALTCTRLEILRKYNDSQSACSLANAISRFYHAHTAEYEDRKIEENGDVV